MGKLALKPRRTVREGYFVSPKGHHRVMGSCRIMCSPLIWTGSTTSSNPHQLTWSSLQARSAAAQEEPFLDTLIGGLAFAALVVALAFI